MRKEQGITLIALVITIIILLILAGVTINLTIGENGIFKLAQNVGENYVNAHDKELADLENLYSQIKVATNDGSQITITMEDLNKFIESKIEEKAKTQVVGPDYKKCETITFTNKSYTVQKDGYIQVHFYYTSSMNEATGILDYLYINNAVVFRNNASVCWQNPYSPIFSVKKGDVIRYTNDAQQVTGFYYPIR